jgi:hypothetical protein
MPATESARHLELKRLALVWAQTHGYRIAAAEVSVPNFRARLDAAAYRPVVAQRHRTERPEGRAGGATAIFECKQSRADFLKDSRCAGQISARLAKLHERRERYEASMRLHVPSLRNADALFPEFDSYRFEAAGYEPYDKLTRELRMLAGRLHGQTKFADLARWRAANVHYVVAEEAVVKPHELPHGWGLLVRQESGLVVQTEPIWHDATEEARMTLLLRIAMAGTRAVNQSMGIVWPEWPRRETVSGSTKAQPRTRIQGQ